MPITMIAPRMGRATGRIATSAEVASEAMLVKPAVRAEVMVTGSD